MPSSDPCTLQKFRAEYRAEVLPPGYSGWRHATWVGAVGLSSVACAVAVAHQSWRPIDFWVVPATLALANVVEYIAHRGPMHHRVRGLGLLHLRHARRHHRYFTDRAMHFESTDDFHAVLFPPVLLCFFGGIVAVLGLLAALFLSPAVAALFFATSMGYYLLYEALHFCYHQPPGTVAARLPVVRWLALLHRRHHAPSLSLQCNFNLVFPMTDWMAGTLDAGLSPRNRRSVSGSAAEGAE